MQLFHFISLQFTNRAKLGNKAFVILKKGKPMPDALLIEIIIEAIRYVCIKSDLDI